jgi:hypothetical protein
LTLNVLPLTDDLIVELQEILLQHKHFFALHLVILGYNLRLLKDMCLNFEEFKRGVFKGDRTTLGPLLKHLLIETDGTRNEDAKPRLSGLKRTTGWREEKFEVFLGICKEDTECILIGEILTIGCFIISLFMIGCFVFRERAVPICEHQQIRK